MRLNRAYTRAAYPTSQAAAALGLDDAQEFHVLRNSRSPEHQIPATEGTGTRDQLWSAFDVARLAVLRCAGGTAGLTPEERKHLWDNLGAGAARREFEAALNGEPVWLILAPDFFWIGQNDPRTVVKGEQLFGVGLVDVYAVVEQAVGCLFPQHRPRALSD